MLLAILHTYWFLTLIWEFVQSNKFTDFRNFILRILKNTDISSRFKFCRKKQFDDFKWFIQFFFYIKWLPVTNNWCTNMYQHFHRKYFNLIDVNTITCTGASKFANKYKQVDNMIPLKGVHKRLETLSLICSHLQQFWYHEWKYCPISRCPY